MTYEISSQIPLPPNRSLRPQRQYRLPTLTFSLNQSPKPPPRLPTLIPLNFPRQLSIHFKEIAVRRTGVGVPEGYCDGEEVEFGGGEG